jgi:hypothetical protein
MKYLNDLLNYSFSNVILIIYYYFSISVILSLIFIHKFTLYCLYVNVNLNFIFLFFLNPYLQTFDNGLYEVKTTYLDLQILHFFMPTLHADVYILDFCIIVIKATLFYSISSRMEDFYY